MTDDTVTINRESMLPIGTLLQGGKYRIERYLSSGGFGNTYVATNTVFEEQVAIKEFFMRGISERQGDSVTVSVSNRDNVSQFSAQMEKFGKEARRLRKLRNPHIVAVHDLFEENGTRYYVMDLIKGESLSTRLKRTQQPVSEQEALSILDQVLDALSVVHAQGLYHLDLKPANIMVDGQGRALLIDFGASKQISQEGGATTSTGLCYTPGYAPLEQISQNAQQFGPWTDLYALGATLYYMLTLHPLPTPDELYENPGLLQMEGMVGHKMQQVIRKLMTPVRTQRPQSVAEVRALLNSPATGEETKPVTAAPQSEETESLFPSKSATAPKQQVRQPVKQQTVQPVTVETGSPQKRTWITVVAFIVGLCFIVGLAGGVFLFNSVTEKPEPPVVVIPTDTATVAPIAHPTKREEPVKPERVQTTTSKPTKKPTTTSTATPTRPSKIPQTTTTVPSKPSTSPSQPAQPSNHNQSSGASPLDNLEF